MNTLDLIEKADSLADESTDAAEANVLREISAAWETIYKMRYGIATQEEIDRGIAWAKRVQAKDQK